MDDDKKTHRGSVIMGIIVAVIMTIAGGYVGYTSEIKHIKYKEQLKESNKYEVNSIDKNKINPDYEGKLVYIDDDIESSNKITDTDFNVSIDNALFIDRIVNIYQWVEHKPDPKYNSNQNAYYKEEWSDKTIDSSTFVKQDERYKNNTNIEYQTKRIFGDIHLGEYLIPNKMFEELESDANNVIELNSNDIKLPNGYQIISNNITNCPSLKEPVNGCIKIYYKYNDDKHAAILAKQTGNTFTEYKDSKNTIFFFSTYEYKKSEILEELELVPKKEMNNIWLYRFIAALLLSCGIAFFIGGIKKIIIIIKAISRGDIYGLIETPMISPLIFIVGIIIEILIITFVYFTYYPLITIPISIVLIILSIIIISYNNKQLNKEKTAFNKAQNIETNQEIITEPITELVQEMPTEIITEAPTEALTIDDIIIKQ